jgi:hypothetical protein
MVETEEREMTINGKTFIGVVTKTTDGVDEHGNPKVSINVKVPSADFFAVPGENGE